MAKKNAANYKTSKAKAWEMNQARNQDKYRSGYENIRWDKSNESKQ